MVKIQDYVIRTPLIRSNLQDTKTQLFLKPENLQCFGSYKIRGIASLVDNLNQDQLMAGIYAASAGNMAQAAAFAALKLNIPCTIYLPETAPDIKKTMIKQLGAHIVEMPYQQVWGMVRGDVSHDAHGIFIHPAFNEQLRKGYATISTEILTDLPEVDAIVIPFGVGGLALGIGMEIKRLRADVTIYTCEPETAAPLKMSLNAGRAMAVNRQHSFVDAIGTPEVLADVFELITPIVTDSIVVSLSEISDALRALMLQKKLVCEGAAACAYAAGLKLVSMGKYRNIVCILSGGNLAEEIIKQMLN